MRVQARTGSATAVSRNLGPGDDSFRSRPSFGGGEIFSSAAFHQGRYEVAGLAAVESTVGVAYRCRNVLRLNLVIGVGESSPDVGEPNLFGFVLHHGASLPPMWPTVNLVFTSPGKVVRQDAHIKN